MAELHPFTNADLESLSGAVVGRFVIGDRLGKGGMGEVYLAEDTRLKRQVALKRLAPSLRADAVYRHRFQEEAQRASRFTDSHVAALYDVMEEQGEIFLVMEYIEGETLRQRLRRPLTLEQFFDIAMQCAEALSAAHDRGIVHCDIKPENIMLTTAGQVKILDFGVAKHLPRSDQSSTVDRSGTMGGTPAYMSPEVLLEKIPDGRADVFSLGVVFYEALTGHHPFLAASFVATTDRIRSETPTPIRIFNSQVPEGLEALVSKAMSKEAGQRHATARELLEDLRLVQAGLTPTKLRPLLPSPFVQKSAGWIIALSAAVIAIVLFTFLHRAQSTPILSERGWVLVGDFESRGDEPIPDAGVREGLTIALQQSRYVNVFPRSRVYDTLQRMKKPEGTRVDEALGREICQRENLQVLLTGSIEHVGRTYQITVRALDPRNGNLLFAERERFDNKEEFFDKADTLARKARKDLGESLGGIEKASRPLAKVTTTSLEALQLYSQAKDAMDQGKLDEVLSPLQGALKLDPNFAMAHLRLAEYYGAVVSKNENVVAEARAAYDLRQGVTDREKLWIEAHYFLVQERYEDALQSLSVLVSLYPDDLDYHLALADAYDGVARPDKTIIELREILRLNSNSVSAYSQLVSYLARTNANDEAIAVYEQAKQRGIDTPELHRGLGLAYMGQGKIAEARQEFHVVEQAGQPYLDLGEFSLAGADVYEGKLKDARGRLGSVVQRDQVSHSKGLQLVAFAMLGRISLLTGQTAQAEEQAKSILAASPADLQTVDLVSAGTLLARAGALSESRAVLRRLEQDNQQSPTAWNKASTLTLQGYIALSEKQPEGAVTAFTAAETTYPEPSAQEGLALAYEAKQDWEAAGKQWQEVLGARGEVLQEGFPANLPLAKLYSARACAKQNDIAGAQQNLSEFLQLWQDNENDTPQPREVLAELQKLIRQTEKQNIRHEGADQTRPRK